MKLYSWNVNGFRAVVDKGFWDWFRQCDGDVVCLGDAVYLFFTPGGFHDALRLIGGF